ncbi:hypothetical protein M0R45_030076 [Rubus argutus]|uniref:Uncharacterized protein n=1 Tax=Rubus argutus TaxID=59490 RepID=A0AAW1WA75_RUBAR
MILVFGYLRVRIWEKSKHESCPEGRNESNALDGMIFGDRMNLLWAIMTPRTFGCFPLPSENLPDMLYRGIHGVSSPPPPGTGLLGVQSELLLGTRGGLEGGHMSSERGGMCFHESGRLVDSIGLRADIARLCRW